MKCFRRGRVATWFAIAFALAACNNTVTSISGTKGGSGTTGSTTPSPTPSSPQGQGSEGAVVPSGALSDLNLERSSKWAFQHDTGTPGSSTGLTSLTSSPSMNGMESRQFTSSYTDWGGELFHLSFDNDPYSTTFLYDVWLWIPSSNTGTFGNLEMDMNQVIADGDTVIYGFQCDGDYGTWDYTENVGTPTSPVDKWVRSSAPCNPRNWPKNTWNHVQVEYSRDGVGNVTYQTVWLNGVAANINATVPSAFTLGWASGVLLTNLQIDGGDSGSGDLTVYATGMSVYRW